MIPFSQQYQIISGLAVSFGLHKKVQPKLGNLEDQKSRYRYQKYETWTLHNFRFLVLWLAYERYATINDLYKLLNVLDKEDKDRIQKIKNSLSYTRTRS